MRGAFISTALFGKFDKMATGLFGIWADPDSYLYRYFMPGQPLNASGVNDPKLATHDLQLAAEAKGGRFLFDTRIDRRRNHARDDEKSNRRDSGGFEGFVLALVKADTLDLAVADGEEC